MIVPGGIMWLTFFSIRHMTQHDPTGWRTHLQLIKEETIRTRVCARRGVTDLQALTRAQQMHSPFEEVKLRPDSLLTVCQRTVCYADDSRATRFMARSSS
ncbi:hypothetical protein DBV39_10695 [Orrella marina]|uniref:Uncharacterized protein n=1 Tax=Orrella marina TaxID=2163011 RepID=A0A2R4XJW3_9BURK|nr:hypothetical protein DBV39_10695 [Orrella marina]